MLISEQNQISEASRDLTHIFSWLCFAFLFCFIWCSWVETVRDIGQIVVRQLRDNRYVSAYGSDCGRTHCGNILLKVNAVPSLLTFFLAGNFCLRTSDVVPTLHHRWDPVGIGTHRRWVPSQRESLPPAQRSRPLLPGSSSLLEGSIEEVTGSWIQCRRNVASFLFIWIFKLSTRNDPKNPKIVTNFNSKNQIFDKFWPKIQISDKKLP